MAVCRQLAVIATLVAFGWSTGLAATQTPAAQPPQRPTFRASVDLVTVAAVARDRKGRFVRGLTKEDFTVLEAGRQRPIVEFHAEENAPVDVALLFDVSGSMRVASKIEDARQAARHLLSALRLEGDRTDEAAVFSFDIGLQSLQAFTTDPGAIEQALSRVRPYGQTSIYDAVAETASQVAESKGGRLAQRRAVVVLTDGVDTSSLLSPQRVAEIASGIDVPVYVLVVLSPLDHPGEPDGVKTQGNATTDSGELRELAHHTGGELFLVSAPAHASIAARQIIDELRHQYVLAFDATPGGGWKPLDVKVRRRDVTVRARTGYSGGRSSSAPVS